MTVDAFPLQWPHHVPRIAPQAQSQGGFQVTPGKATSDLVAEVARSGGTNLIVSTNMPVRRDGLPYANAREPDDPGVAVYFMRKGKQVCIPCDSFDRVWKNIRAIGLSIRDMRGPEARGCAAITDQAFTGFLALPAPSGKADWWHVLNVPRDTIEDEINAAYRSKVRGLAMVPVSMDQDRALAALNVARDEALAELRAEAQ